jgi:hypothetical protein
MNDKQIEILEMLITCLREVRLGDDRSFKKERQKIKDKFNILEAEDWQWIDVETHFLNMLEEIRQIK